MTSPKGPPSFRVVTTSSGATGCVAEGQVFFPYAATFREELLNLIDSGANRVVVDLSGVDTIDSTGVGALVAAYKAARAAGGDLRLAAVSEPVSYVLGMMKLDRILVAYESIEDAFPLQAATT